MTRDPGTARLAAGVEVICRDFERPETWLDVLDGTAGCPLVHEADVAEVAVAALLTDCHLGAAYTITGPVKVSQAEQVQAIGAAIGEEIRFAELTPQQAREHWLREGWPEEFADWRIALLADSIDGPGALPPTGTFQQITGRPPGTFAQWAHDHAAGFRPPARTEKTAAAYSWGSGSIQLWLRRRRRRAGFA